MISLQSTRSQVLLGPTTVATTTRSASFEFTGSDFALIHVLQSASAGTNGGVSVSLLHADSVPTQATQFSTMVADLTSQATTSHEKVYFVDTRGAKRYGKIILTPTTHTNDSIINAAHVVFGRLEAAPSNTSAMVSTTNDPVRVFSASA
jgi:hypothetical protein